MEMPNIVAVDFDGTCVYHEYPEVGADVPYAVEVLKALVARGTKIILWTMRSDDRLADAVAWFEARGIPLWGANENPTQASWTNSPKVYAPVYIDDAALGCPLERNDDTARPFVNWKAAAMLLGVWDAVRKEVS